MSNIRIAIKPKYPTRRATDKVLFNEGNFLDVIDEYSDRHILSILDTAHVAIINDTTGKYYPVNKDNYKEQFALAVAGEVPTVDADEKFGVKKMENFITASTSEAAKKIQDCAIYNGILTGHLFKVTDFKKIGDEKIDKNGFWMMFEYDKTGAEAEGYSNAHILDESEELVDGTNYVYFGTDDAYLNSAFFGIDSTLTVDGESGDNLAIFENTLIGKVLIDTDDLPKCMLNGIQYDELQYLIRCSFPVVQLVQPVCRLQANGGCRIAESQQVGGDICRNAFHRPVIFGSPPEQQLQHRTQYCCDPFAQAGLLHQLQNA